MSEVEKRKAIEDKGKSLDFGCGIGRLTFPLSRAFKESHGVDISEAMISKANVCRDQKGMFNCQFHTNTKSDLGLFKDETFNFILSIIVLQHMEPTYFLHYIKEFLRVLKKDGVLVFQLPDATENRADYTEYSDDIEPVMEMYGMCRTEIVTFLETHGGVVLDVIEDNSCGPELSSYRYFVTK